MRRALRWMGWTFIGMGCFVLYFLVYQLVGTDAVTNHAQSNLRRTLAQEWAKAPPPKTGAGAGVARTTPVAVALGAPIGLLDIPKINLKNVVIVQGTNRDQLAMGPGQVTSTVMPGQPGTFAVSGHRTTHSRPFYHLDELAKGDTITVVTQQAVYTYTVTDMRVVLPTDTEVLDNVRAPDGKLEPRIVLTTCHPRYSASHRLVVFGVLTHTAVNDGKAAA